MFTKAKKWESLIATRGFDSFDIPPTQDRRRQSCDKKLIRRARALGLITPRLKGSVLLVHLYRKDKKKRYV